MYIIIQVLFSLWKKYAWKFTNVPFTSRKPNNIQLEKKHFPKIAKILINFQDFSWFQKMLYSLRKKIAKNCTFTKCTAQMIAIVAPKTLYKIGPFQKQSKTVLIWLRKDRGGGKSSLQGGRPWIWKKKWKNAILQKLPYVYQNPTTRKDATH